MSTQNSKESRSGKTPRTPRPFVEGRSVLVLKEKHGSRYFVVDKDEELFAAAIIILRGRLKTGYYYYDPGSPPPGPDFSQADADKLPTSLREAALSKLKRHEEALRLYTHDKQEWEDINLVCATADGRAAWRILVGRSDHEYERAYLESASTSYDSY